MTRKNLLFIYLLFSLSIYSYAQIGDTVIKIDKEKIFTFYDRYYTSLIRDIDNPDYNWLSICDLGIKDNGGNLKNYIIYRVDDNLNILDSLKTYTHYQQIKFDNKLYGFCLVNFINFDISIGPILDTITFESRNLDGSLIRRKIISTLAVDSLKCRLLTPRVFFTKDSNFLIFRTDYTQDSSVDMNILLVDTAGNIIKSKTINKKGDINYTELSENINNFELLVGGLNLKSFLYSIKLFSFDKNTLEIVDSVVNFDFPFLPYNFRFINDSIFITISENIANNNIMDINIVNKNTKKIKIINAPIRKDSFFYFSDNHPAFSNRIDYKRLDSIYFVYLSSNQAAIFPNIKPEDCIMSLVNFNINGTLNYYYDFKFDSLELKHIRNVKATQDGGLIIIAQQSLPIVHYIIKFMPNGFVGLTNTETGENESIKVYPNPAKDYINIDIEADSFKSSDVELFDMQGRLVKKSKLNAQIGNRIDVSTLSSGAYTYRVVINGKGISGKVVIGE